jgi:hypothetical protein
MHSLDRKPGLFPPKYAQLRARPNNVFQPTRCAALAPRDRWHFGASADLSMLSRSGRLNTSRWAARRWKASLPIGVDVGGDCQPSAHACVACKGRRRQECETRMLALVLAKARLYRLRSVSGGAGRAALQGRRRQRGCTPVRQSRTDQGAPRMPSFWHKKASGPTPCSSRPAALRLRFKIGGILAPVLTYRCLLAQRAAEHEPLGRRPSVPILI